MAAGHHDRAAKEFLAATRVDRGEAGLITMAHLYAARSYLARRGRPRGGDLGGHDFVGFDETYQQKQLIGWLGQRARGGRCTLRTNSSHGILAAVQAGMGVGSADYDHDGNLDIVKTNFAGDTTSLYRNLGKNVFEDTTFQAGFGRNAIRWW